MKMLALSVRQPWAWALFHGKHIENRSWPLPNHIIGQTVAIHASSYKNWEWEEITPSQWKSIGIETPPKDPPMGALIGTVKVVGQFPQNSESLWKIKGQYGFVFTDAKKFDKPIPCKGRLGFFEVEI